MRYHSAYILVADIATWTRDGSEVANERLRKENASQYSTKSHVLVLLHRQMSRSAVCTHLWLRRQQMEQYYPAGRSFGRPLATDARPGTHAASDADATVVFNSAPRPGCKNTVICY